VPSFTSVNERVTAESDTLPTERFVTVPGLWGGGATAVTATVAEPVSPPAVAVMVAVPAAIPVTTPLPETVAT
jgi:hypothetical protein